MRVSNFGQDGIKSFPGNPSRNIYLVCHVVQFREQVTPSWDKDLLALKKSIENLSVRVWRHLELVQIYLGLEAGIQRIHALLKNKIVVLIKIANLSLFFIASSNFPLKSCFLIIPISNPTRLQMPLNRKVANCNAPKGGTPAWPCAKKNFPQNILRNILRSQNFE